MSLRKYLSAPVPIHTLVWLRIGIGLLGGGDILGNGIYYHWYHAAYSDYTFRYYGFEWVHPLPEPFFSLFFIVGFLLGLAVAVGYRFRITAPLFALAFTYLFLLEKANYLNHAYLFTWLAWLLVLVPAWREWSWDVWRQPRHWSPVVPRWSIAFFPLMMGVVYFFGGVAKINADWLLEADPLHQWVRYRGGDIPLIGPLFKLKTTAYFMAWGGFLLDISVAFWLLHKRYRWWAMAAVVFFHATNHLIFNIGIFPYLSLIMSSLWFEPDWPARFVDWLGKRNSTVGRWQRAWKERLRGFQSSQGDNSLAGEAQLRYTGHSPFRGETLGRGANRLESFDRPIYSKAIMGSLGLVIAVHIFLPLRHHLIEGDVAWTEEGHRYSWRMMLRSKQGGGYFEIKIPEIDTTYRISPGKKLTARQTRKLYTHPDMILQYAHHLEAECVNEFGHPCQVFAHIRTKLNDGRHHIYVDPEIDLSKVEWTWIKRKTWILEEGSNE